MALEDQFHNTCHKSVFSSKFKVDKNHIYKKNNILSDRFASSRV